SAVHVIAKNGYHQSQVSKIAEHAGVADGTIYLYFKNKEDLLISLFREKMGMFINEIKRSIQHEKFPHLKLKCLIQKHFQQLASDHSLAIVTQLELRQSTLTLRKTINQTLKPYLMIIDQI